MWQVYRELKGLSMPMTKQGGKKRKTYLYLKSWRPWTSYLKVFQQIKNLSKSELPKKIFYSAFKAVWCKKPSSPSASYQSTHQRAYPRVLPLFPARQGNRGGGIVYCEIGLRVREFIEPHIVCQILQRIVRGENAFRKRKGLLYWHTGKQKHVDTWMVIIRFCVYHVLMQKN